MRVMFFVDSISRGGAGRCVSIISNALAKKGFDVSIVLLAPATDYEAQYDKLNASIKLYVIDELVYQKKTRHSSSIRYIKSVIDEYKPDFCVCFMTIYTEYVAFSRLFHRYKILACERNDPAIEPRNKAARLLRPIALRLSDYIICQTPEMKDYFGRGIALKSVVIPNPVTRNLPEAYHGEREKRIVSVGRLNDQKNYPVAIRGFALFSQRNPEYQYEIYGEGPLKNELIELTEHLGIKDKVHFMGQSNNIHNMIRKAACFVISSDYEGMSNALMEAMAIGVPCISTNRDIGDARLLIEHEVNGILIPLRNSETLADEMEKLVRNQQISEEISRNAQRVRDTYSEKKIVEKWMSLFQMT